MFLKIFMLPNLDGGGRKRYEVSLPVNIYFEQLAVTVSDCSA